MQRTLDEFGYLPANSLVAGDRVAVCYGIITIKAIELDGARLTIVPVENQPSVGMSCFNTVKLAKSL
jgi:hypothetical protein